VFCCVCKKYIELIDKSPAGFDCFVLPDEFKIAMCISVPIAWSFMHSWLENYQYRADMSWWIVGATGFMVLFITLLTISFHTIKASLMNPVKSLRSE
jgi:hypothetical protein